MNRMEAGYLYVKNPMNPLQVSRIILSPGTVDFIVFWSKNPERIIDHLHRIKNYDYYFQYTLNPYDTTIEKNLPPKNTLIDTFIRLSDLIGPERVIWRYDPVFFTPKYTYDFHLEAFEFLAKKLTGFTRKCMTSFLTVYQKCKINMKSIQFHLPDVETRFKLLSQLSLIANSGNIELMTCAVPEDYSSIGIVKGKCIDDDLIYRLTGKRPVPGKDTGQREECYCAPSIDIGAYNTCTHGCIYCYANYNHTEAEKIFRLHKNNSELLSGALTGTEKIKTRGKTHDPVENQSQPELFN